MQPPRRPIPVLIALAIVAVGANLGIDALRGWKVPNPPWQFPATMLPFMWLWLWVWQGFRQPADGGPKSDRPFRMSPDDLRKAFWFLAWAVIVLAVINVGIAVFAFSGDARGRAVLVAGDAISISLAMGALYVLTRKFSKAAP